MFNQPGRTTSYFVEVILLILFAAATVPAHAQHPDTFQSVDSRPRPNYDPQGTRIGIFDLNASLDVAIGYSDNILAASENESDDFLTTLGPSISLKTDWGRTALEISATMSLGRHVDFSGEDFDDHAIRVDWRRRLGSDGLLRLGGRMARGHDSRREPTDEDGIEPNQYQLDAISLGLGGTAGILDLDLDLEARDLEYEDAQALNTIINNDDRNRRDNRLRFRVGLSSQRAISPFLQINIDERDYAQQFDDFGVARSSDGSEIGIGIRARNLGKINGELVLGRIRRSYQTDQLPDYDDFWARADFGWNLTGLTTLRLQFETRIDETTYGAVAGVDVDEIELRLDHELLRNMVFSLGTRHARKQYVSSRRDDDISTWFGKATYLLSNHMRLSFELESNDRDSTVSSESFDENIYRIVMRAAL